MQKFLETPELLEKLLPYLDLGTTLTLAQTHEKTRHILQGSLAWNKLIRRNSPLEELEKVQNLGQILKLTKEPKANMLDLLDVICSGPFSAEQWLSGSVRLGCPRHPNSPHWIPLEKLQLLEQAEVAFDTREQTVEEVKCATLDDPALSVLGDRLAFQEAKMTSLSASGILIGTRRSAEAFRTIMGASQEVIPGQPKSVDWSWLRCQVAGLFFGPIGGEGWSAVAEGIQSHPGVVGSFAAPKEAMGEASREDLRNIWDALSQDGVWIVDELYWIVKQHGEAGWRRLEHILARFQ